MGRSFVNPLGSNYVPGLSNSTHELGANRSGHSHGGNDLFTSGKGCGAPVYASSDGIVTEGSGTVGRGPTGLKVGLDHGDGIYSNYFHLSHACVKPGQSVVQGQQIGNVGNSGTRTSPCHLHYELNQNHQYQNQGGTPVRDPNDNNRLLGVNNTQFDTSCGGGEKNSCGSTTAKQDHRPGAKDKTKSMSASASSTTSADASASTTSKQKCNKIDTTATVQAEQRNFAQDHPVERILRTLDRHRHYKNGGELTRDMVSEIASNGTSGKGAGQNFIPPVSNFLTSLIGSNHNSASATSILSGLASLSENGGKLMHFTQMDTPTLHKMIQIIRSISGIPGLEKMPYFRPLSESIGSSLNTIQGIGDLKSKDYITNAATSLGRTSPISKMHRNKLHPTLLENIDKMHEELNKSLQMNLGQLNSQIAGFMGQINQLLNLLPPQLKSALAPILGKIQGLQGQAVGFIQQIMGVYEKLSSLAHGLDMIVDLAHLNRTHDLQEQMLKKTTDKYGDEIRVAHPNAKGGVVVPIGDIEKLIHNDHVPTLSTLYGEKKMDNPFWRQQSEDNSSTEKPSGNAFLHPDFEVPGSGFTAGGGEGGGAGAGSNF